jgi:capsular polysaccharide transport system permease protein
MMSNSPSQSGLARQARVITALTIREIRLKNSKHAFSQLFDLMEALVFIVVHFLIFKYLGRHLIIGDSLLLFITTGIFPVLFFRSISIKAASALESAHQVTSVPYVEALDFAIARGFVEFLSFGSLFLAFFAMLTLFEVSRYSMPFNPIALVQFLALITLFAFGLGLVNSFFIHMFPLWKFLWGMISKVQIFLSGVFFIPEYMPPAARDILYYNPNMHFVALFRTAFYPTYPTHMLSFNYMIGWTFGVMIVGLALERVLRNQRSSH